MTDALLGAARLRALCAEHGVTPRKSLGQNFVIDPNTIRKVVDVANLSPDDVVLEIGAGPGSLTLGLADVAASVVAMEIDDRVVGALRSATSAASNVSVVAGDALKLDLGSFGANAMVANLPYNLAATIVIKTLQEAPGIRTLTVMTQREVGERLAASPGNAAYGAPSVMVAFFAGTVAVATAVSRHAFWPQPNVDSVVLRIERRDSDLLNERDREKMFAVVRAAFSQRRKTLRSSIAPIAGSPVEVERACEKAGLNSGARAEELSLEDFVALSEAIA